MSLFALADFWNAFYAVGGFVVGVIGVAVGVLGFWYTIQQVRKTQAAAEAAKQAADATLAESRETFRRYLVANAHRAVSELRMLVEGERWETAGFRADDLAEILAQLRPLDPAEASLEAQVSFFRQMADVFRRRWKGQAAAFYQKRWTTALAGLNTYLDRARIPFRVSEGPK